MYILAPKMHILAPKCTYKYIIAPKMYILCAKMHILVHICT